MRPTGRNRWALRALGIGAAAAIVFALSVAVAANNLVTVSRADDVTLPQGPNDFKPPECAALTLQNLVVVPGTATNQNDLYLGNAAANAMDGGNGNDCILGGAGNDTLSGSAGNDVILGGDGDDLVFGGSGNDILYGGLGNDILNGGPGNDILYGGPGDDVLNGGPGYDICYGGGGVDTFVSCEETYP